MVFTQTEQTTYLYSLNTTSYTKQKSERTSFCSARYTGSITVEAAYAIPFFFFAVLVLFYMVEVMSVRTTIRCGMQYAAKAAAEEACLRPVISGGSIQQDIVSGIGRDRLNASIVVGGSSGISCEGSGLSPVTGVLDVKVSYAVRVPVPVFAVAPVRMEEHMRVKAWTGYQKPLIPDREEDTVYVTEHGMVYHRDYHCPHLELSIRMVPSSGLDSLRNAGGGKYHACPLCAKKGMGSAVYVTTYGDRYHTSLGCSGLKRTVYAIPLSEAAGKGACSKCCH